MCTALTYVDAAGRAYVARTLELNMEVPYGLLVAPSGSAFRSQVPGKDAVEWSSSHAFIAMMAPQTTSGAPLNFTEIVMLDGTNDAGLTVNFNAFPPTSLDAPTPDAPAVLEASDLGIWLLSQFGTVAEAKAAVAAQPVNSTRMECAAGVPFPLHAMVTDAGGDAIVIEWHAGVMDVLDNPVRVMANGPAFSWHLTNLDNWTHLDNTDKSMATFGALQVGQPDSGIATASLPASNTSVGRFVRAAYYTTFAEKLDDPDQALAMAVHIINNFDRPKGITIDLPDKGGEGVKFGGSLAPSGISTEYTTHSFVADAARGRYHVRANTALNWSVFHLDRLAKLDQPHLLEIDSLDPMGGDATDLVSSGITR